MSIIGRIGDRPTPNPNVLIELGFALHALGGERVVLVMNTSFGDPSQLPFDLRMRRTLTYESAPGDGERAAARLHLERQLDRSVRTIFEHIETTAAQPAPSVSLLEAAREAIRAAAPGRQRATDLVLSDILERLQKEAPPSAGPEIDRGHEELALAIDRTIQVVLDFSLLVQEIAAADDERLLETAFAWFERIAERLYVAPGTSGTFFEYDFDYYRFIGHEMLVLVAAMLIRERRWTLIGRLFSRELFVRNARHGGPSAVGFDYLNQEVLLLQLRNERLHLHRASLRADILKQRYSESALASVVTFEEFKYADYFLFLRATLPADPNPRYARWCPWTALYMDSGSMPRYLVEARSRRFAEEQLIPALALESLDQLRTRFAERRWYLHQCFPGATPFFAVGSVRVEDFGSRP